MYIYLCGFLLHIYNILRRTYSSYPFGTARTRNLPHKPLHYLYFLILIRKSHGQLHKKAVKLCLRKRKCSGSLYRILRSYNNKRLVQPICHTINRHLMLLHALKQARLCSRRCTVNLIRKNNIAKYRTLSERKFSFLLIIEINSGHIRRKQIWSELHS